MPALHCEVPELLPPSQAAGLAAAAAAPVERG